MKKTFAIGLRVTLLTLILTGLLYPVVVTGLAQGLFPNRANGSLLTDARGNIIGSELIGQGFASPAYFQPRVSAAGDKGYDATASSGSNLGSTAMKLRDRVIAGSERLRRENGNARGDVPADLITASGSGLDPHVSPQSAMWQVPRIASARKLSPQRVEAVVSELSEGRDFGILGEARVNVLLLNITLDRRFGRPPQVRASSTNTVTP
jgi:K+-transporting ATPase ATPase C chain